MDAMPLTLKSEFVLLCEGGADRQFFRKLTEKRAGLAKFDFPFPTDKLHGNGAFGGMLMALRGDRVGFARLKGVLVVADSTDDPPVLFKLICDQIRLVGGFGVPSKLLEIARAPGQPAIAIMLLPDESTPGALETLLAREITEKSPWITPCVDQFLRCDKVEAHAWPAEKRDKARFHSMVAALNREDPSRAATYVFKDPDPFVAIEAPCFDDVEKRLKEFCADVAALPTSPSPPP
jgi:hypothetical protein